MAARHVSAAPMKARRLARVLCVSNRAGGGATSAAAAAGAGSPTACIRNQPSRIPLDSTSTTGLVK